MDYRQANLNVRGELVVGSCDRDAKKEGMLIYNVYGYGRQLKWYRLLNCQNDIRMGNQNLTSSLSCSVSLCVLFGCSGSS